MDHTPDSSTHRRKGFFQRSHKHANNRVFGEELDQSMLSWKEIWGQIRHHLNDRVVLEFCHKVEMVLCTILLAAIFLLRNKVTLEPVLLASLAIICTIALYRVHLFGKLNENLQAIVGKTKGKFIEGSSFMATPPQAYFVYHHQDCQVISCVDRNFRLMLELNCYFGKETEFRIEHKVKKSGTETVAHGKAKHLLDDVLADPAMKKYLETILFKFSYLHYGKDGIMRVGESFDGRLTHMDTVFGTLEAMSSIGKFLKLDG